MADAWTLEASTRLARGANRPDGPALRCPTGTPILPVDKALAKFSRLGCGTPPGQALTSRLFLAQVVILGGNYPRSLVLTPIPSGTR
jgi:hypothetical protein